MANTISLTKENIEYIRDAFSHFFPEDTVYSADKPYASGEFNWNNRKEFIGFVFRLTGVQIKSEKDFESIKKAQLAVEGLVETEAKKPEANRPTKEQLETLEKEAEERTAAQKKAVGDAKNAVEVAIKKQKEIAEATKNSKVYVKTKLPKAAKLTDDQAKAIETLKTAAKADPQRLVQEITNTIEEKVKPNLPPEVTEEEAQAIYKQAAYRIVTNLQGKSLAKEAVIENAIPRDKKILPKIITDKDTLGAFNYSAVSVSGPKILDYILTRRVASAAFGEAFAKNVFGPEKLSNVKVAFSATPKEGFIPYDLSQIPNQYSDSLNNTNSFIGSLKSFGEGEIKSQLLSHAGAWLDTQVAKLPAESFLAQAYNSELVQGALSYFGLGNLIAWEGTTFMGRITIENGFGPVLGWAQNLTGLNLGVSKAVSAVATEVIGDAVTTTAAAEVGTEVAAGTVGATVGTGAGVVIGQITIPIPVVGAILGAIGGWIVSKIPWKKVGKWSAAIIGGVAGLIALPFVGLGAALGIGLGTAGISAALGGGLGGLTLGRIGSGIAGFFGALGGAFLGAIGTPILVTLLVFPVVVALILFIINSGAYIVPPGQTLLSSTNAYIDVQKKADPPGPLGSPQTITYTVTITAKKDALTAISFKNECHAIKKSGSGVDCKSLEKIPDPPTGSISPGTPSSFTFTSNYDSKYKDSLISDTITVSATSASGGKVSETGSSSICFGDCPTNCFKTVDNNEAWPANFKANLDAAAATLGGTYPNFAAKACAGGTVNLCYTTQSPSPIGTGGLCNEAIYARHDHSSSCDINFNQCGLRSQSDALYILTHEVTHHIQTISGHYLQLFTEQVPSSEWAICSYAATAGNEYESMAEGDALFVGTASWASCVSNYASQYPKHYQFAKSVMFAP